MVAVMFALKHVKAPLLYNEEKVRLGQADLIDAGYYLKEAQHLSAKEKMARLTNRAALNLRTQHPFTHLSLNFHPSEKIPLPVLKAIAQAYLNEIGYRHQPYLLYEHHDAAHPHVHVLTTCIQAGGQRIDVGPTLIKTASERIEEHFQLRRAQESSAPGLVAQLRRAEYAQAPTLQAVDAVVSQLLPRYSFTNEAEMNALLSLYGVRLAIHRGKGRRNGLRYQIISSRGKPQGVPVKAQDLSINPNRQYLRKQFAFHGLSRRHMPLEALERRIRLCLYPARQLADFIDHLSRQGLNLVKEARSGALVYIDHERKAALLASSLGPQVDTTALLSQFRLSASQLELALKPLELEQRGQLRSLGRALSFHL